MSALAHSRELARVDVLRAVRKAREKTYQVVVYAVLFLAMGAGSGYLAFRLGEAITSGDAGDLASIEPLRGLLAVFWVIVVFVLALRAVGQRGKLANAPGVLTVVPTREAVLGVMLAEAAYVAPWALVPGLGLGVGLAAGTGDVATVVTVPASFLAAGVAAVAVGYPVGLTVNYVLSRFEFVARNKNALIVVAFVAYFLVISTGQFNQAVVSLFDPMQRTPLGWYADLALVGSDVVAAAPLFAAAAPAVTGVVFGAGFLAATAVAERYWFADPVLAGEEESVTEAGEYTGTGRVERALAGQFGRPTAALVALAWRRAKRAPMKLLYAAYPLLALTGVVADILQTGEVPAYLPVLILVFVVWAVSVVFTLNPLGDQGAALPATVLSRVGGREFVAGHVLAGVVLGIPLGTVLTAAVAVVSPVDTQTVVALTVATPPLLVACSVLAVGIGVAFPRYDAVNVTQSVETVVPSVFAFVAFSLYVVLTTAAAAIAYEELARTLVAGLLSWVLPFGLSVTADTLSLVAVGSLVPLALAPLVSYRYAVRRFESFTVD